MMYNSFYIVCIQLEWALSLSLMQVVPLFSLCDLHSSCVTDIQDTYITYIPRDIQTYLGIYIHIYISRDIHCAKIILIYRQQCKIIYNTCICNILHEIYVYILCKYYSMFSYMYRKACMYVCLCCNMYVWNIHIFICVIISYNIYRKCHTILNINIQIYFISKEFTQKIYNLLL